MAAHLDVGQQGEDLALAHLRAQGMSLVHRRWRYRNFDELDLVMQHGTGPAAELVIVEVKTLTRAGDYRPEDAFTPTKKKTLRRAAEAYCALENVTQVVRIDLVAVTLATGVIEHFVDVRLD
jgi:putative endonuclease